MDRAERVTRIRGVVIEVGRAVLTAVVTVALGALVEMLRDRLGARRRLPGRVIPFRRKE